MQEDEKKKWWDNVEGFETEGLDQNSLWFWWLNESGQYRLGIFT